MEIVNYIVARKASDGYSLKCVRNHLVKLYRPGDLSADGFNFASAFLVQPSTVSTFALVGMIVAQGRNFGSLHQRMFAIV